MKKYTLKKAYAHNKHRLMRPQGDSNPCCKIENLES